MGAVDAIAEQYVADLIEVSPIVATFLGVAGHEHELDDFSPAGTGALADLNRRALAELEAAQPANERERVAKETMVERVGLELERYDAGDEYLSLNVVDSSAHRIRQIFDMMPAGDESEAEALAERMSKVPRALAQYIETLRAEAAAGRVAARRQVEEVAVQCAQWAGDGGTDVWRRRAESVTGASESLCRRLEAAAQSASEATAAFAAFLRTELAPVAPEKDAVGRDRYARASRAFLGIESDLAENYAWAWQELHRIESEMARTAEQIKAGATVAEAAALLDADPEWTIASRDEFRDWMQDLADRTVADMADTHFDIPEPLRRIECMIAPTSDGTVYYTWPSEDFSRPGRMWWSVPTGQKGFGTWREFTTVYHEGVPGHHLQLGYAAYLSGSLNRYQRQLVHCSGHGEGWAMYAERLMEELGYLDEPALRLGLLDSQALRTVRVILDIGVHAEFDIPVDNPFGFAPGQSWTYDLAWRFLRSHSRIGEDTQRYELNRYLGWPGQAPAYKIGERHWRRAREEYKQRKGSAFDLKQFHTDALSLGSLGLAPFHAALERL